MRYSDIYKKVSEETGIDSDVVGKAYRSYWEFIREIIKSLPLKDCSSEEEFNKLRTNFNIPSLGKLNCTYDRIVGLKKKYEHIKKLRENAKSEEDKTNVYIIGDNNE